MAGKAVCEGMGTMEMGEAGAGAELHDERPLLQERGAP
jgi:hypothetical protein